MGKTANRTMLKFRQVRMAGVHVIEAPWAPDQSPADEGSHIRFAATYPDSLRLDRWLWSFGPDISEVCKEAMGGVVRGRVVIADRRDFLELSLPLAGEGVKTGRLWAQAARQPMRRYRQAPRVQSLSSRSRWCAAKHADGYRDTVYRRIG